MSFPPLNRAASALTQGSPEGEQRLRVDGIFLGGLASRLSNTGLSQAVQVRFQLIGAFDVEEALFREIKRECRFDRHQILERGLRCWLIAEMPQRGYEMGPRPILGIWNLHGSSRPGGRILELTAEKMGQRSIGEEAPAERVVRAQAHRHLELFDGLIEPALIGERVSESDAPRATKLAYNVLQGAGARRQNSGTFVDTDGWSAAARRDFG